MGLYVSCHLSDNLPVRNSCSVMDPCMRFPCFYPRLSTRQVLISMHHLSMSYGSVSLVIYIIISVTLVSLTFLSRLQGDSSQFTIRPRLCLGLLYDMRHWIFRRSYWTTLLCQSVRPMLGIPATNF